MANTMAKTRPADQPYEVWTDGSWTWKVLKFYKTRENTLSDQYGRVFCEVDGFYNELGDVYYAEIRSQAHLVATDYPA